MYKNNSSDSFKDSVKRKFGDVKGKYAARKDFKEKEQGFSNSSGKLKDARSQSSETQEEVLLTFPTLETVEKSTLGYYQSILNRTNDGGVDLDDLDRLQPELELLLSAAAVRLRTLQNEISNITAVEDKAALVLNNRKRKLNETRTTQSMKDLSKLREQESSTKLDGMSSENETDNSENFTSDSNQLDDPPKVVLPKNDTSNKFWSSIEPYVADITEGQIKDIEALIQSCDNDMAGIKVPPLGPHYTTKWADEDLEMEKRASAGRHIKTSQPSESDDCVGIFNRASTLCSDRIPGPFVQRLVSALIEEPDDENCSKITDEKYFLDESEAAMYLSKLPLYHTTACFERRIRRKLEVVGLLDTSDDEETDEILSEIRKCEDELKVVAAQNKNHLVRLLEDAKLEMKRQEIRNKVKLLDTEIIEIYRKTAAAKLKKKQLQAKEKEQAWKLLKDREMLLQSLEAIK